MKQKAESWFKVNMEAMTMFPIESYHIYITPSFFPEIFISHQLWVSHNANNVEFSNKEDRHNPYPPGAKI